MLRLIAQGLSNVTYVARLLAKLGARDRLQAVVMTYERRVLRPGSS